MAAASARQERFEFARDNPDLVAYMLTLRTELLMRIVMPAVVGHSDLEPYMDMARFEVGPNGNPHWHGMSVGRRSPQFRHVKDDVGGEGDLPPETASEDVRACQRLWEKEDPGVWPEGAEKSGVELEELVRRALSVSTGNDASLGAEDGDDDESTETSRGGHSSESDDGDQGRSIDLLFERVKVAVQGLVDAGLIELVTPGGVATERDGLGAVYRRVPPVPVVNDSAGFARPGARQRRWKKGEKLSELVDPGILKRSEADGRDRSALQEEFDAFFSGMVSEWNPCYTEDGQCRYRWDAELGAPMPEVEVTAEDRAQRLVNGQEPERVNLRHVLDEVCGAGVLEPDEVDVHPLRRLVAALVQRVARHTKHGLQPPKVGVHACARGKESCPYCRYGFPHQRLPRGGMVMEKGDREGQWHARFRETTVCAATMSRTCCWPTWVTSIGVQF